MVTESSSLFDTIISLFAYATFLSLAIVGIFLIYKRFKRKPSAENLFNLITLLIEVPKNNEKSPLAAEQMFASLHGILRSKPEIQAGATQEHLSLEIVSQRKFIRFFVTIPEHLSDFIEGQIYAQYPGVAIKKVDDFTNSISLDNTHLSGSEIILNKSDVYPIKTFLNFEVDPLAGITSTLSKTENEEQIWVQLLIKPIDDSWKNRGLSYVAAVRAGKPVGQTFIQTLIKGIIALTGEAISAFLSPAAKKGAKPAAVTTPKLPGPVETALTGIEEKTTKLGFLSRIRIASLANDPIIARSRLNAIVATLKQFNTTNLNGFSMGSYYENDPTFFAFFKSRIMGNNGYILNIEELASIYHLPNITVATPNIVWAGSKQGEPPSTLPVMGTIPPDELTLFAETDFRDLKLKFGIKNSDRRRHMYIIGKSGVGKTTMLENMVIADIRAGRGVAVVDPHGDFIKTILDYVPSYRINDVVLFDPSDRDHPVAFNPLENVHEDLRGLVASGFISIVEKIWSTSWGPRLEHILRNTILALLEDPNSTMLGINRMYVDDQYRNKIINILTDPVVKNFWLNEFLAFDKKFKTEAISPIQNKIGQFLSTPTIRNIVGQPKSTIDIKDIMDNKKILLVKLSQGEIGEDNSALLGAMIITKIQLAAMARAAIPEDERQDFYLYVDEFQNFATESFGKILSEARKYHLNLTVANQYTAQVPEEVMSAVFGNVGTIVSFRVGAQDAAFLLKEFEPVFEENDLVNLDIYHIYIKLSIDGMTTPAFSAITLPPPIQKNQNFEKILKLSRERYSQDRSFIEKKINEELQNVFEQQPQSERPQYQSQQQRQYEKKQEPAKILRYENYSPKYKEYLEQERNISKQIEKTIKEIPEKFKPQKAQHQAIKPKIAQPQIQKKQEEKIEQKFDSVRIGKDIPQTPSIIDKILKPKESEFKPPKKITPDIAKLKELLKEVPQDQKQPNSTIQINEGELAEDESIKF